MNKVDQSHARIRTHRLVLAAKNGMMINNRPKSKSIVEIMAINMPQRERERKTEIFSIIRKKKNIGNWPQDAFECQWLFTAIWLSARPENEKKNNLVAAIFDCGRLIWPCFEFVVYVVHQPACHFCSSNTERPFTHFKVALVTVANWERKMVSF